MKFRFVDLKKIINVGKKPKRNVVYKIGYDKFSLKKFLNCTKECIMSTKNKDRLKSIKIAIKDLFKVKKV